MSLENIVEPSEDAKLEMLYGSNLMRKDVSFLVPVDANLMVVGIQLKKGINPDAVVTAIGNNANVLAVEKGIAHTSRTTLPAGKQMRCYLSAHIRIEDIPQENPI